MNRTRLYAQNGNKWSEEDRNEIAKLLVKLGYCVKIGRERPQGKSQGTYIYFVEYWNE